MNMVEAYLRKTRTEFSEAMYRDFNKKVQDCVEKYSARRKVITYACAIYEVEVRQYPENRDSLREQVATVFSQLYPYWEKDVIVGYIDTFVNPH